MKLLIILLLQCLLLVRCAHGHQIIGAIDYFLITLKRDCVKEKQLHGLTYEQMHAAGTLPETNRVTLNLYTNETNMLPFNMSSVHRIPGDPHFDIEKPIVIYFHGFTDYPNDDKARSLALSYHQVGGFNFLALNAWTLIGYNYLKSTTHVIVLGKLVGQAVADFMAAIFRSAPPPSLHFIGHSLGAHIAGAVATEYRSITHKSVDRITGLDPAKACFVESVSSEFKLDATDATFVDIIHSNDAYYGSSYPKGHADFYPNGGLFQGPICDVFSSHHRSVFLFSESIISPLEFLAVSCPDWDIFNANGCRDNPRKYMGFGVDTSARGKYYLWTSSFPPYGVGDEGAQKKGLIT